jgi:hypothetical protein
MVHCKQILAFTTFKKKAKVAYMKKINLKPFVLILVAIGLVSIAFFLIRNFTFRDANYLKLPADSTVMAVEWAADFKSEELKSLSRKIDFPTAVQLVNLESKYFSAQNLKPLLVNAELDSKTVAFIKTDSIINPILIYTFKNSTTLNRTVSLPGFAYFIQGNKIFLANSIEPLNAILNSTRNLESLPRFQDAIANLPKFNILDFYLNHELFAPQDLSGLLSLFESINQKFGVTVGALRATPSGLVFSTYTNENSETNFGFPVTRNKYTPTIPTALNDNQLVFFSGVNVATRLNKLIGNEKLATEILSLLNSYNLTPESLRILTTILNDEFAIAYDKDQNLNFLFPNLSSKMQTSLEDELSRLAAYFNPVKKPYKLEDGTMAQVLSPAENFSPTKISENITEYEFESINSTLYFGRNISQNLDYISTSQDPFNNLSTSGLLLSQNPFFAAGIKTLLPIADEILYLNRDFIYPTVAEFADLQDVPNTMTATNFFNDGIQTVTLMSW